jgi:hypothetical protein
MSRIQISNLDCKNSILETCLDKSNEIFGGQGMSTEGYFGVGLGSVTLGLAIVATPIGVVGATAAFGFSLFGGISIGTGLRRIMNVDVVSK